MSNEPYSDARRETRRRERRNLFSNELWTFVSHIATLGFRDWIRFEFLMVRYEVSAHMGTVALFFSLFLPSRYGTSSPWGVSYKLMKRSFFELIPKICFLFQLLAFTLIHRFFFRLLYISSTSFAQIKFNLLIAFWIVYDTFRLSMFAQSLERWFSDAFRFFHKPFHKQFSQNIKEWNFQTSIVDECNATY